MRAACTELHIFEISPTISPVSLSIDLEMTTAAYGRRDGGGTLDGAGMPANDPSSTAKHFQAAKTQKPSISIFYTAQKCRLADFKYQKCET